MYLESPQNPRVREWAHLKTRKGRNDLQKFIVEGYRLVDEVLRSSVDVESLLWDVGTDELPQDVQEAAIERGVPIFELSPKAFASVSDTTTPQGVIAIAKIPSERSDGSFVPARILMLDGLQDPGNVGTLIRTADAFGIDEVCCGTGTVDPFSPKVVRASMGGIFRVPVSANDSVTYIQRWLTRFPDGYVVTASADAPVSCDDFDFKRPFILLIGSEGFGVSEATRLLANAEVKIPMSGVVESLNAAMAGSVILYEAYRQQK